MADARNRTPKKTKNENMHGFRRIVGVLVVFPWSVFHPPPPLAKISWCAKKNILSVSARGGGGFFQKVNAWWNGTGLEWNPPKYQLFFAKGNDFWLGCSISCDGQCLLGVLFFDLCKGGRGIEKSQKRQPRFRFLFKNQHLYSRFAPWEVVGFFLRFLGGWKFWYMFFFWRGILWISGKSSFPATV